MMGIEERVEEAKTNALEMERFLKDYLPFIKKQIIPVRELEYDDMLSVAMVTFVGCVRQYVPERGSFLAFAAACIRNRLADECRRTLRYTSRIAPGLPAYGEEEPLFLNALEQDASMNAYNRDLERRGLRDEIEAYARDLADFGLSFHDLAAICPKRNGARGLSVRAARETLRDARLREELVKNHRLSQSKLAAICGVSSKTIEKHRKYIVSVAVLLMGDYPGMRSFLPKLDGEKTERGFEAE